MSRRQMILTNKDVLSGLLFLLIAGIVAWGARGLPVGTALRMGPGFFPPVLAGILAVLGLLTLLDGLRNLTPENATAPLAWGRMLVVCGGAVFFAWGLGPLGMPLAVFGAVLISASASRQFRILPGLGLAALAALGAWLIFAWALGLPFQMLGSWLQAGGAA
ncbi:tripartite tricarboxylate transporter TctB family protein [Paracoccus sp. DMF-8]|uniref:tripartite tricarboxylate transporter TctB family protein n=1 Tax=Paracoccus sp. DMF-8 TaxID=3019445 RepID=UPI0023E3DD29|nr:tripartite tricarboxylate transporter TctB family protein [Paracoccus sp. DMF-8]MDF3608207.1 tripartite tricarboxylate transporter TctB family protein [Paracoccus sp. DMF-8]